MRKNKVLYLTNTPSPYRVDFFNELGKRCNLTVLFERESSSHRDEGWYNHNFDYFEGIFLNGLKLKKNDQLNFGIIKYLKKDLFDFIVIGGYSTLTGMLAINYLNYKNIPFVLNVDGGLIPVSEKKIKYKFKKYFISSASYWLSTGKNTNEYLEYYGAKKKDIHIYPFTTMHEDEICEVPLSPKEKSIVKRSLDIKETKMILTVGRFTHSKGFDVLIEASRELPKHYGIYIVGGKATDEYLILKEKYNLNNIHFVNFKTKEELKLYYQAADLFVLPTRQDVWGLVINESMSFGLPTITTDKCVAGVEMIKDKENGFIIPVDNSKEITDKIITILSDTKLITKMGYNSLKTARRYTIENMAKVHKKIFQKIYERQIK